MNDKMIRHKDGDDKTSLVATKTAPFNMIEFRERLLAKAGVTEDVLAETLRKTYDRLNDALDATKVERTTYRGEVVSENVDADFRARLKAIEVFLDSFGITANPRNVPEPNSATTIVVEIRNWWNDDSSDTVNVTPIEKNAEAVGR